MVQGFDGLIQGGYLLKQLFTVGLLTATTLLLSACTSPLSGQESCRESEKILKSLSRAVNIYSSIVDETNKEIRSKEFFDAIQKQTGKLRTIKTDNQEVRDSITGLADSYDRFSAEVLLWGNGSIEGSSISTKAVEDALFGYGLTCASEYIN